MFDDLSIKPTAPANTAPQSGATPVVGFNQGVQGANVNQAPRTAGVEDIFSGTEKPEKPAILQPIQNENRQAMAEEQMLRQYEATIGSDHSGFAQKIFASIALIAVIALLGVGGYWGYKYFKDRQSQTAIITPDTVPTQEDTILPETELPATDTTDSTNTTTDENAEVPAEDIPDQPIPETLMPVDTDQDGLSDDEEKLLGTNANSSDTDGDGLFDREESKVYGTDPLSKDTDGDTFTDGAEVQAGYNPKGSGKLYDFN